MGDHSKREQLCPSAAREVADDPKPAPKLPRCHCGAPAVLHVSKWRADRFYCQAHAHEAEL
jgi:hypothetical protein